MTLFQMKSCQLETFAFETYNGKLKLLSLAAYGLLAGPPWLGVKRTRIWGFAYLAMSLFYRWNSFLKKELCLDPPLLEGSR